MYCTCSIFRKIFPAVDCFPALPFFFRVFCTTHLTTRTGLLISFWLIPVYLRNLREQPPYTLDSHRIRRPGAAFTPVSTASFFPKSKTPSNLRTYADAVDVGERRLK